jgi:hypothetical protein
MSSETLMDNLRADGRDVVDHLLPQELRERWPDVSWLWHDVSPSVTKARISWTASSVHFVRGGWIWLDARLVEETGMRSRIVSR